jgi:hypothetical protein
MKATPIGSLAQAMGLSKDALSDSVFVNIGMTAEREA